MSLGRHRIAIELVVCTVLVAVVAFNALRRMDYLGDNAEHIRMTDASRTAYVAKNLADGNGYTTNDLPASMIDFYAREGKLDAEHWVNADRFPFAAYATAALYTITQSTSWEVGILLYNLLAFIGFLVLLYRITRSLWNDRNAAICAVAIALLHPYTFQFLYWKDADMLLLTTACIALLYRYYTTPSGTLSRASAVALGTLLAFQFLSRPNLGLAFVLFVGLSVLKRIWDGRKDGLGAALKRHATRELLVLVVFVVWCIPFVIHSMSEWGTPLFSANGLYQLPLGTRYGMGTDTWWKYTEPGHPVTLELLASTDTKLLISKFTSSWLTTIKNLLASYPLEIALTCGLAAWLGRQAATDPELRARYRTMRLIGYVIAFAAVTNFLILPLYSFQKYSWRHYLAFALPLFWIASGRAITLIAAYVWPALQRARDHVTAHGRWYALAVIVAIIGWNFAAASGDTNRLLTRTSRFIQLHWLSTLLLLCAVLARPLLRRVPRTLWPVIVAFALVMSCYQPNVQMKVANFQWFPSNDAVWNTMRGRSGLVSSLALQGEVGWNTGRKNVSAPEWPMHVYSYLYDHKLEIEDIYIESAEQLLAGPFLRAAPGFEGYLRLQQHRVFPGYELAFHDEGIRGYPVAKLANLMKASTVFRLVDRAAVQAMRKSPDSIDLGDPANVIYAPHGWERYVTVEGKRMAMGTNVTRKRYSVLFPEIPWEDASVTFFLDDRRPRSVELEVYVPQAGTFDFYWNLDLYAYDLPADRPAHRIGQLVTTTPGWHTVHLDIPAQLLRTGLNKLGFRASKFRPISVCADSVPDAVCLATPVYRGPLPKDVEPAQFIVRTTAGTESFTRFASLFAGTLTFQY